MPFTATKLKCSFFSPILKKNSKQISPSALPNIIDNEIDHHYLFSCLGSLYYYYYILIPTYLTTFNQMSLDCSARCDLFMA